jgi:flavin-dependent dehydrogenase
MASSNSEVQINLVDIPNTHLDWLGDEAKEMGWIVDRQAWDNWQLEQAKKRGVDVFTKHTVNEVQNYSADKGVRLQVKDRTENETFEVRVNACGLAVGPNWDLAVQAGFKRQEVEPPEEELHMGVQYHMQDPDYFDEYGWDNIYLYFDSEYAPKGYTWSFPEGKELTRWGCGVPLSEDVSASSYISKYLQDHGKGDYIGSVDNHTMSLIPTAKPLDTCVHKNVGLIGDTGHHCDPMHGGGMLFGARAGKAFAQAVVRDDIGLYDEIWKDDFLSTLQHRFVLKDLIYNMSSSELDRFISSMEGFTPTSFNPDTEIPRLMWHCMKRDGSIFTKAATDATKSFMRQKLGM